MLRGLRACVRLRALPVKARKAKLARDSRYQTPINSASRHQNLNDVRLTRAASMSNGGEESAAKKAAAEGYGVDGVAWNFDL